MKRYKHLFLMLLAIFTLSSCKSQATDNFHLGLNVEVVDVNKEDKTLTVVSLDEDNTYGFEGQGVIEVSDSTIIKLDDHNKPQPYAFDDIKPGDQLAINLHDSQLKALGENASTEVHDIQVK